MVQPPYGIQLIQSCKTGSRFCTGETVKWIKYLIIPAWRESLLELTAVKSRGVQWNRYHVAVLGTAVHEANVNLYPLKRRRQKPPHLREMLRDDTLKVGNAFLNRRFTSLLTAVLPEILSYTEYLAEIIPGHTNSHTPKKARRNDTRHPARSLLFVRFRRD